MSGSRSVLSAMSHSAIEYTLTFSDEWRIAETKDAKLGYALPAARDEYDHVGDLTLFAGWRLDDDSPTVWVNGTGIVPGRSQTGDGWSYSSATGQLSLDTGSATHTVSGVSTNGKIAIRVEAPQPDPPLRPLSPSPLSPL